MTAIILTWAHLAFGRALGGPGRNNAGDCSSSWDGLALWMAKLQKKTVAAGSGIYIYVVDMPSKEKWVLPNVLEVLRSSSAAFTTCKCEWFGSCLDGVGVSTAGIEGCWLIFGCSDLSSYLSWSIKVSFVSASSSFHRPCRKRMAHLPP